MEKGKRILFLADINSVHTERWVKSLTQRGFSIYLFSLTAPKSNWVKDCINFEFKSFNVDQGTVEASSRFGKFSYFKARKEAKEYFNSVKPDLVHAHYASSYGMLGKSIGFKKTILSLWGSDVYEFPKRSLLHSILFKRAVRFASVVCSTSKDMAREAKLWVDRPYVITPFGIDPTKFKIASKDRSELLTLGTVKSLEDVYGIDRLITLYDEFRKNYKGESVLLIYGSGSKEEILKQQVVDLGISEHVHFKGFVEQEELVAAFQSLDIFIALSRRESFGVAILEAQACGVPVLVTDVGGLPEVTSPETGTIVDATNPKEWADQLIETVDKINNHSMSSLSREFVLKNFSNEVCVDKIIQVYKDAQGI